ncbi:putative transcription initiation factor TFIIH subunit 1 [Paratrimastix pyriformis]|uniref:Transcription initiation factor TFIIH subunit 1 n=1 Tax=Paratrimastix pyriformis TaxID=342808 RepID=A0ABQ8UFE1_9EUKA|nr:putative transcription initiation factor TFIIH subunit 1 [Paratrimastix pyriformis]
MDAKRFATGLPNGLFPSIKGSSEGGCNKVLFHLSDALIKRIFLEYPAVKLAYEDNVPHHMTKEAFWARYCQRSHLDRGDDVDSQALSSQDMDFIDKYKQRAAPQASPVHSQLPITADLIANATHMLDEKLVLEGSLGSVEAPRLVTNLSRKEQNAIKRLVAQYNRHGKLLLESQFGALATSSPQSDSSPGKAEFLAPPEDLQAQPSQQPIPLQIEDLSQYFQPPLPQSENGAGNGTVGVQAPVFKHPSIHCSDDNALPAQGTSAILVDEDLEEMHVPPRTLASSFRQELGSAFAVNATGAVSYPLLERPLTTCCATGPDLVASINSFLRREPPPPPIATLPPEAMAEVGKQYGELLDLLSAFWRNNPPRSLPGFLKWAEVAQQLHEMTMTEHSTMRQMATRLQLRLRSPSATALSPVDPAQQAEVLGQVVASLIDQAQFALTKYDEVMNRNERFAARIKAYMNQQNALRQQQMMMHQQQRLSAPLGAPQYTSGLPLMQTAEGTSEGRSAPYLARPSSAAPPTIDEATEPSDESMPTFDAPIAKSADRMVLVASGPGREKAKRAELASILTARSRR